VSSRHQLPTGSSLAVCKLFTRNYVTYKKNDFGSRKLSLSSSELEQIRKVSNVATLMNCIISIFFFTYRTQSLAILLRARNVPASNPSLKTAYPDRIFIIFYSRFV
jgi:hypothetical protein